MTFEMFLFELNKAGWLLRACYQTSQSSLHIQVYREADSRTELCETKTLAEGIKSILFCIKQERPGVAVAGVNRGHMMKGASSDDKRALQIARQGIRPVRQHEIAVALQGVIDALEAKRVGDDAGTRSDSGEDDL